MITKEFRGRQLKQKPMVIWFTGLSGSGKTTLASALVEKLNIQGYFAQLLDGDIMRSCITKHLSFSQPDRIENIRLISEVAKLFFECGIITICATISPNNNIRTMSRSIIGNENFIEIYLNTPINVCERRDVKGLYKKARLGEVINFTGISADYEQPLNADLTIDTSLITLEKCVEMIKQFITSKIKH